MRSPRMHLASTLCLALATACGSSASEKKDAAAPAPPPAAAPAATPQDGGGDDMGGTVDPMPADISGDEKETPPMGKEKLEAWLTAGHYKAWKCEAEAHASRPPSGHSDNRICSNKKIAAAGDSGDYPIGAASVKELFDSSGKLNGYAVMVRTSSGAGGDKWYWYERIGTSTVADGQGTKGSAKSICVSCHARAGTSGNTGRDSVFTQIK